MRAEPIYHPNDKPLNAFLSHPDNARVIFQNHRPCELAHFVDWNSLVLESSTISAPRDDASRALRE